jgi:peptide/nickel transport system ATP-binding protein
MTSLNPIFTIGRQISEVLIRHKGMTASQAREETVRLLEKVRIPNASSRFDEYPHQFSGGMRQRIVIALALAANPKLIIADEPTTALDVSVQAQIIALLKKLCSDNGTAVILVTHDIGVIAEAADRIAVMYAGRLVEIGPRNEVLGEPRHPYTKGLMGSIPHMGRRGGRLAQIDGVMPRLDRIPAGCAFNPRCASSMETCRQTVPPMFNAGSSHAACWLHSPDAALLAAGAKEESRWPGH